jgi:hypothetical protein
MSWIKLIFKNLIIFLALIFTLEIGAGSSRVIIGKEFLPFFSHLGFEVSDKDHPCVEMKTDVLLSNVPNHPDECHIKDGITQGEYVIYKYASEDLPKILTLGGSTTSGFYQHISNGETYPKLLAKMVSKTHFLVNGGVGGYSSLQEFLKFSRDGSRMDNLDIVISLNGINDIRDYHGMENIRKNEYPFLTDIQYLMNQKQIWYDQRINSGLVTKTIQNMLPNTNSLVSYLSNRRLNHFSSKKDKNNLLKSINAAQRWETNVRRLNTIAKLENIKYFVFLQPTMGLSGIQSNPKPGTNDALIFNNMGKMGKRYVEELNEFYKQLKLRCSKLSFCIDISDEAPPSGNNYKDPRHHNQNGNKIIAEVIFKSIFTQN